MRKILCLFILFLGIASLQPQTVLAQRRATPSASIAPTLIATESATASATVSATTSTASATVEQKIQEKKDNDITDTSGKQKDKLLAFLDANPLGPLSWNNFVGYAVRYATQQGVPANVLVLMILFPFVAAFIAASRHIVGLRGFGIYIPAVLSVALVSTGPLVGIIIFSAIISVAMLSKRVLRFAQMPYLPRTGLLLWLISVAVLGMMLVAPILGVVNIISLNIFPILILVLLSENFLDAQANSKPSDAFALTLETLGLALVCSFFLSWDYLQKIALLQPELVLLSAVILNLVVGKFVGLRLTEWFRFRPIIEE